MLRRLLIGLAVAAGLWTAAPATAAVSDPLVFTAPPRETPEAGATLYGPLVDHLSELLGRPVVYRHPGNWLNYARDIRAGAYDVVFDGPHFTSWRTVHLGHRVLAKLPGNLVFHVVLPADSDIRGLEDLVGKEFCGIAPPNLGTMTVISMFPNPVRQPVIKPIRGGFDKVYEAVAAGKCAAGVLRTQFYDKKLTAEQRAGLRILTTSKALPGQAISAGPRLSAAELTKVAASLVHGTGVQATQPILGRFGGKAKALVPATAAEFEGLNLLLEGVVFGW